MADVRRVITRDPVTSRPVRPALHRRTAVLLVSLLVIVSSVLTTGVASAAPCPGGALQVVAHPDDDLLFQSPDLIRDIQSGRCMRTVFVTGGDAGGPIGGIENRESGIQAAYAWMAGVANSWTTADAGIEGRSVRMATLNAAPRISLVYLRLPDGGLDGAGFDAYRLESLAKLVSGAIPSIQATDGSETYTRDGLISALTSLISNFGPAVVRTLNPDPAERDHPDHRAVGSLTSAAHASYPEARALAIYRGYSVTDYPVNVSGADLAAKHSAMQTYGAYDPTALPADEWISRQYLIRTIAGPGQAPASRAPVADAGVDQSVPAGASVTLTGAGSTDPDGDAMTYAWSQTGGPTVVLSGGNTVRPTFDAPAAGSVVTFSLVVSDGSLSSAADSVTVSVGEALAGVNVARAAGAVVTASSANGADGQTAAKAVDGSPLGYPADYTREWASVGQGVGAWWQVAWSAPVTLDRVVLRDRPNVNDWVTGASLIFSDGTAVPVGELNNDGSATTILFPARATTSLRLSVTGVGPRTVNVGLAELEAWGEGATAPAN